MVLSTVSAQRSSRVLLDLSIWCQIEEWAVWSNRSLRVSRIGYSLRLDCICLLNLLHALHRSFRHRPLKEANQAESNGQLVEVFSHYM